MSGKASTRHAITLEVRHAIIKWIVRAAFGTVIYGLILFLSAGRLDWVWGWEDRVGIQIHISGIVWG